MQYLGDSDKQNLKQDGKKCLSKIKIKHAH